MTELDSARKAARMAWDALDMLEEAQELAERAPSEGVFSLLVGFCEELDVILRRLEHEAEARWRRPRGCPLSAAMEAPR